MKNTFLNKIESSVRVKITGKNVNNYLKRLIANKIDLIDLKYNSHNEAVVTIKYSDYLKLKTVRSSYDVKVTNTYGKLRIRNKMKRSYILLSSIILGIALIILLSNIIFSIEVIHTNKSVIELVSNELNKNGLKKYTFKKKYKDIKKIEDKILNDNKDKLEWISIDIIGTKYVVRIEERKIKNENNDNIYQDIVASKSGVIKKIIALSGEKKYEIDNFVSKGDTIIKGSITKPNNEVILTHASGLVYAEVWYQISVEYPYQYKEEILTGNKKNIYYLKFINKRLELFNFKKYKNFQKEPKILLYNNILPISLVKEKQYEVNIIDEIYTTEEVINKAITLAESRLMSSNKKIDKIERVSIIKKEEYDSKIRLDLFISVIEEIGEVKILNEESN
ncbi:MAG: sporulation protein YqfD [Bacilli bacterium]|nr:sporulation protein YqfD [Bacilli bacterium]